MDTKHLLIRNRQDHLRLILKLCGRTEDNLKEDISTIKNWFKTQPHLPETPSDQTIIAFLAFNKFSIETTKLRLDMYYTLRDILPELYENKNPRLPHMQDTANRTYCIPLPKIAPEGIRVTVIKIVEENANNFDPYNFFAHSYNIVEIRMQEDICLADVLVYDLEFLKIGHILKLTPTSLKQALIVLEKVFANKMKEIHYINSPPYVDRLMSLVKPLLKPKLAKRLFIHQNVDELFQYIPMEILPKDYGGEELSLKELSELWKQKLVEYQDRFDDLDKMKTNEELRPTPLVNDDILGFYGNFRQLNVD